jgi:UDP-glucose 4-epimerase
VKIAVTGASGFLGRYVVEALSGHDLLLLGRSRARLEERFPEMSSASLRETDYSLDDTVDCVAGAEGVVHLCGVRFQRSYESIKDYAANIEVSDTLFRACAGQGIANVVFASTCSVYAPGVNELPFREDEPVAPRNLYAISKRTAEQIGLMRLSGIKCLRIAQLLGAEERGGFMVRTFIDAARNGKPLTVFGKGVGRREYLYVTDAAAAIAAALAHPDTRGVFNVGSGVNHSHRELAEAVVREMGDGRSAVVADTSKEEDTAELLMDSTRFRETFNWKPRYTLEEALREIKGSDD